MKTRVGIYYCTIQIQTGTAMPSRYSFAWRERVADPGFLVWCHCGHSEQIHGENHGACTAGQVGRRCMCDAFTEKRREWVGFGDAP